MNHRAKNASQLILEASSITLAVILGFAATEWGELRRNRETGRQAVAAIERELSSNLTAVSRAAPYYETMARAVVELLESDGDAPLDPGKIEGWRGLSPPLMRSASFDLAVSTGALEHVDFDLADLISQTYEMQSNLVLAIDQALSAIVAGRLSQFSDWLRVAALLAELTQQAQMAIEDALPYLTTEGV